MDKKYLHLFNEITDAIDELEKLKRKLMEVQQDTEEMYLSHDE